MAILSQQFKQCIKSKLFFEFQVSSNDLQTFNIPVLVHFHRILERTLKLVLTGHRTPLSRPCR